MRLTPQFQCKSAAGGAPSSPAGILALLVVSVLFQSLVAAAHMHGSPPRPQRTCSAANECSLAVRSNTTVPYAPLEDHGGCLLCQAVSQGGAILLSSHLSVVHRADLSSVVAIPTSQRPNHFILAYGSRQRGPPLR